MVKKEYSTKEILLGLREESKRVKSELDKATSMLIYDKSTYKIESLIDRENRLYFNAVLNSKDISYLKALRQILKGKCSVSTEVGKYKGEYELLWPDGFPVRIDERKKEEFTKVLDALLRSTSERMFEDTSQYRLNRMSYLPLTISIDSAVNNVFPYKCVYDGNRDILLFSSLYEDINSRLIKRILDANYKSEILSDKAKKIIEESDIAKKDVSIVDFSESRKDSEFIITEYPNSVSLTFKKKK